VAVKVNGCALAVTAHKAKTTSEALNFIGAPKFGDVNLRCLARRGAIFLIALAPPCDRQTPFLSKFLLCREGGS
jgi:hypothetical protein